MKNIFLVLSVLFVCACSSIPNSDKGMSPNTLIQKPNFNYKIKSLPRDINIYFVQGDNTSDLPLAIQGFIANSYFYNDKVSYKPNIYFSPIKNGKCKTNEQKADLIIAFDLSFNSGDTYYQECLKTLPKSKTLYVSNHSNALGFDKNFIITREEEKNKLIQELINSSTRFIVIDNESTSDKKDIKRLLEEFEKEVLETKTYNFSYSSQNLFAEILMLNRSEERIRKISRRLSKNISGVSRTRDDTDSFFLSVNLNEARSLKPALDYISEKNFNISILNSWSTNTPYKSLDKDLIGSINSDLPIMMPIKIPEYISEDKRSREFAIGYDVFEIMLLMNGSVNTNNFIYRGLSGGIKIDKRQVLRSAYVFKITSQGIEIL